MGVLNDYNITPANNNAAPPDGAPENGVLLPDLNDIFRELMSRLKKHEKDLDWSLTLGGSATVMTLTTNAGHASLFDGFRIRCVAGFDSVAGGTTLNVDGIGAATVRILSDGIGGVPDDPQTTSWLAGDRLTFLYTGGVWVLIENASNQLNVLQERDNVAGFYTLGTVDIGRHIVADLSATLSFPASGIPVGATGWIRNAHSSAISINPPGGTGTIRQFRGASILATPGAGISLPVGSAWQWQCVSATEYDLWGTNI